MMHRLFNQMASLPLFWLQRLSSVKVNFDLGYEMKSLNDKKQFERALELYDRYAKNNIQTVPSFAITQALKACTNLHDLERGSIIHGYIESTTKPNSFIITTLINMYAECGDMHKAQSSFYKADNKTPPIYAAMMKAYIKNNQAKQALNLFFEIKDPDEVNTILLFNACAQLKSREALHLVKKTSSEIKNKFIANPRVLTALLNALMKCGDVEYAESVFSLSKTKALQSYGAMMKGYIQNNLSQKAIELFHKIKAPDEVSIILLFNACAQQGTSEALSLVKSLSRKVEKELLSNSYMLSSLLDALMKCGDVHYAELLFSSSKVKTLSMSGAMMKGYIKNGTPQKAIDVFQQIKIPNDVHINLCLNACAQLRTDQALVLVKKLHEEMPKNAFSNPQVFTSLLDALMKCGDIEYSESLFNTSNEKTTHSYGAMMKGYVEHYLPEKAINLFYEMMNTNHVNMSHVSNTATQSKASEISRLIRKDTMVNCAGSLYDDVKEKSLPSYTKIRDDFDEENDSTNVLNALGQRRVHGNEKDIVIFLCAIKAASQLSDYNLAQSIVRQIPQSILTENHIQNALVDLWGKVGSVNEAKETFDRMCQPDKIGYIVMINAYGLNGMGAQAVELYRQMPEEFYDEAAHICVLNACSHSGLIHEARAIFQQCSTKTGNIYTTMIDCLSRASYFEESHALIVEYERDHSPEPAMYMALLSGARNAKNTSLSQTLYDKIKTLFPQTESAIASGAILLANTYASSGDLDKASEIRQWLVKSRMHKKAGVTWTVINGKVYTFTAHDQSHPRADEIHAECEKISNELLKHGHEYDGSWITRPLNQDETVGSVLCGHSERLAIAWNFVVDPNVSRIQLSKNLRVCGDCHRSTKLIAAIRQCEIIARDANRVHHFYTNGQCSCNDYF